MREYRCPGCAAALVRSRSRYGMFWSCGSCDGRAVALAVLRRVVQRDALNDLWRSVIEGARPGSRACPTCGNAMAEVLAGGETGPALDVCRICQLVWFDAGEYYRMPAAEGDAPPSIRELPEEARRELALLEVRRIAEGARESRADLGGMPDRWRALPLALARLLDG